MVDSANGRPPLLSDHLRVTAAAIRLARLKLAEMVAEGAVPEDRFEDVTSVLVLGFDVAESLERLAK